MESLKDIVEFRSTKFSPVLPDASQVNPGVYGAELAYWLCNALAERGVITSYPNSEDWGWFIEYSSDAGAEFAIHCGNIGGANDHWLLSLHRHGRKLFGRDKPSFTEAAPVVEAIKGLVTTDSGFANVEWLFDQVTS